jgi:hypothetical protein
VTLITGIDLEYKYWLNLLGEQESLECLINGLLTEKEKLRNDSFKLKVDIGIKHRDIYNELDLLKNLCVGGPSAVGGNDMSLCKFDDLMEKKISKIENYVEYSKNCINSHRSAGPLADLEEIRGLMGGGGAGQIGDGVFFGVIDGGNFEAEIGNWNCFFREIDESLLAPYLSDFQKLNLERTNQQLAPNYSLKKSEKDPESTTRDGITVQPSDLTTGKDRRWIFYTRLLRIFGKQISAHEDNCLMESKMVELRERELEGKLKYLIDQGEDFEEFKKKNLNDYQDIMPIQDNYFHEKYDLHFDIDLLSESIVKYYNSVIFDEVSREKDTIESKICNLEYLIRYFAF